MANTSCKADILLRDVHGVRVGFVLLRVPRAIELPFVGSGRVVCATIAMVALFATIIKRLFDKVYGVRRKLGS